MILYWNPGQDLPQLGGEQLLLTDLYSQRVPPTHLAITYAAWKTSAPNRPRTPTDK